MLKKFLISMTSRSFLLLFCDQWVLYTIGTKKILKNNEEGNIYISKKNEFYMNK